MIKSAGIALLLKQLEKNPNVLVAVQPDMTFGCTVKERILTRSGDVTFLKVNRLELIEKIRTQYKMFKAGETPWHSST